MILTQQDVLACERELCKRSLAYYAQQAWHVLEPSTKLKWGWALDAICAHLEAVTRGDINRLLMNVPPGTMKSLLVGVIWPSWEWGPRAMPWLRYIGTAHKENLAGRDSLKMRRLVQSSWYQERWPTKLVSDQNAKTKFENDKTGFREAMAFESMTGSRGDRVMVDDPLSVKGGNSEADLQAAEITFTEALPTRVNNDQSAIVVIMQRLHERDTSGVIIAKDLGYTHLMLPMRFEADRRCVTPFYADPRTHDGELLFPERFPEDQVSKLERTLGSYAAAGQLQQRPAPRGGGMFKRHWFKIVSAAPAGTRWVRGWDLAGTDDPTAPRTAGVKLGQRPDGGLIIGDVRTLQAGPMDVERLIVATASQDGPEVKGSLPQDPGQAGKAQSQYLVRQLLGYDYTFSPESGDKETRARPFAAQAEAGNVSILEGEWNEVYLDELCSFPVGKWADQVDATTRAFNVLLGEGFYEIVL